MPGITEILILVLIIVGFILLPRITGRGQKAAPVRVRPAGISGPMRIAVAATLIWPAAFAAYLEPWKGNALAFIYFGIVPVAVCWGGNWVIAGFRGRKR